jgi:D-threo-aldose 1-dehydrogenase
MAEFLPLRRFGPTSLNVTPLSIGCAELGSMPDSFAYSVPLEQALDTLRASFQCPINFLDTAAMYGDGESERRIGMVLKEIGGLPKGYVLATKIDRDLKTNNYSGEQAKRSLERSLELLGVDKLQLVYLHDPEHNLFEDIMARGGAAEVLKGYQEQGVVQHVGLAGGPVDLLIRYVQTGMFEAVITHNRYTLLNRSAEPLIDLAFRQGLAVVNAAPYGSGLLAKGPDAYPRYAYQTASADVIDRTRKMDAICKRYGVPLAAAALQFSTRDPRITSTIVGFSKVERIAQTIELYQCKIPDALWPEVDAVGYETDDPEAGRWK